MKRYIRSLLVLLASAMLLAGVGCAGWGEQTDQDEYGYSPAYEEEQVEEPEGVQEDLDPYGEESGGWETEEGLDEDDQM